MMHTSHLDVVVCTRSAQRRTLLEQCVSAVLGELRDGDTLFLVVDHDEPWRSELAERYAGVGKLRVLPNTATPGLSGSRNTGMQAGDAPVICFLDDDAVPRAGWRDAVVEAFAEEEVIGIGGLITPRFLTADGRSAPRPRWLPEEQYWAVGCDYPSMPAPGEDIRNPIGAAMAVRRSALGPGRGLEFSPALGRVGTGTAGGEETEFFLRLRRAHPTGTVRRISGFHVDHAVPPGRTTLRYLLRRAFGEGRSKAALSGLPHADFSSERGHLGRGILSLSPVDVLVLAAAGLGFVSGRRLHVTPRPVEETAPEVSVILCTDGRGPHLAEAVASILDSDPAPDMEILLVDNSGDPGTVARMLAGTGLLDDPRLRIVPAPVRGLSRARNVGVNAARADVIAFTDDDAVVAPDWVHRLLSAFREEDVWCVTGRTTGLEADSGVELWFEQSGGFDKGGTRRVWHRDSTDVPPLYPYPAGCFGSGNNMAFRRTALEVTGGFAEELGAGRPTRGGEDLDMFRSVILAGGTIVYEPRACVTHRHRSTVEALRRQMYGYGTGMAASLGRCLLDSPSHAAAIIAGVPRGAGIFLRRRTRGRSEEHDAPPAGLSLVEATGYVTGFPLLLASLVRDSYSALKR